jgi:hypothetical protein
MGAPAPCAYRATTTAARRGWGHSPLPARSVGSSEGNRGTMRRRAAQVVAAGHERVAEREERRGIPADAWGQVRGYPLGGGAGERPSIQGVEARRKAAWRRWTRRLVTPLAALHIDRL